MSIKCFILLFHKFSKLMLNKTFCTIYFLVKPYTFVIILTDYLSNRS